MSNEPRRTGPDDGERTDSESAPDLHEGRRGRTRSPTPTGKVERFHKTLRREFLNGKVFNDIADAQHQIDGWVREHNFERPHQSLGMAVPWDRFQLARPQPAELDQPITVTIDDDTPTTPERTGSSASLVSAIALGCGSPVKT